MSPLSFRGLNAPRKNDVDLAVGPAPARLSLGKAMVTDPMKDWSQLHEPVLNWGDDGTGLTKNSSKQNRK
jgi:hypothetical protein